MKTIGVKPLGSSIKGGRDKMKIDSDQFKRTLDTVTMAIIALGLILAIYQAYQIRVSIDLATWNSVAEQWLGMDGIFIDHPELRKYIYDGAAAPTDQKEFDQANAVANKVLDFMDNAIVIEVHTKRYQSDWDDYFEDVFSKSPMICDILKKHTGSYDSKTVSMAQRKCKNW